MNTANLIYGIHDKPRTIKEWGLYALQQLMAVFVATVLIATICRTPISSCFLGGAIGTLVYQLITRFKSPMFISNSGATVSAVIGALALSADKQNYLMVFIGGLIIAAIYCAMAMVVRYKGIDAINKIFPPTIVGAVTIVIGLNLANFIPGYLGGHDEVLVLENLILLKDQILTGEVLSSSLYINYVISLAPACIAIATMIVIAISSHYFKGFLKTIPFLIGLVFGYVVCLILDLCGVDMINWTAFENIKWYPDLAFLH